MAAVVAQQAAAAVAHQAAAAHAAAVNAAANAVANAAGAANAAAAAGEKTLVTVGQGAQPKRLHVSNIPFRFRDPDLRNMFGVRIFTDLFFIMADLVFLLLHDTQS